MHPKWLILSCIALTACNNLVAEQQIGFSTLPNNTVKLQSENGRNLYALGKIQDGRIFLDKSTIRPDESFLQTLTNRKRCASLKGNTNQRNGDLNLLRLITPRLMLTIKETSKNEWRFLALSNADKEVNTTYTCKDNQVKEIYNLKLSRGVNIIHSVYDAAAHTLTSTVDTSTRDVLWIPL